MKVHIVATYTGEVFSVWTEERKALEESETLEERFPELNFARWDVDLDESYAAWEERVGL